MSGLPLSWGPDAVSAVLPGWKVTPLKTIRQGYRRTWVVSAAEQPVGTKLQHDFGLAVIIKRATVQKKKKHIKSLRCMNWTPATEQRKVGREATFPQTWAGVAAAPMQQKAQPAGGQKKKPPRSMEHPSPAR